MIRFWQIIEEIVAEAWAIVENPRLEDNLMENWDLAMSWAKFLPDRPLPGQSDTGPIYKMKMEVLS